jgi:hypothetical protein
VAAFEHRKGRNMTTAIERLRESKEQYMDRECARGKERGRAWAIDRAEYGALKRLAKIDIDTLDVDEPDKVAMEILAAVDPDHDYRSLTVLEELFGTKKTPSAMFMIPFIYGAQEFFAEVENEL